jgi:hypothetical protein
MGTHIHAFLEIDWSSDGDPFAEQGDIFPFNTGEFLVWKDYQLFDALANGRSGNPGLRPRKRPLYPARGIPDVISQSVAEWYYLQVIEPDEDPRELVTEWCHSDDFLPGAIPRDEADRCVAAGDSRLAPDPLVRDVILRVEDGAPQFRRVRRQLVSNPAWHHASWLTLSEIHAALDHFRLRVTKLNAEVQILLQAMALFEKSKGPERVRLVFWFDS